MLYVTQFPAADDVIEPRRHVEVPILVRELLPGEGSRTSLVATLVCASYCVSANTSRTMRRAPLSHVHQGLVLTSSPLPRANVDRERSAGGGRCLQRTLHDYRVP
jgi:hypothetical protein